MQAQAFLPAPYKEIGHDEKKLLNIVLIIGAVGILGSGTAFTSAYLISGDKEVNSFSATEVTVAIKEDFTKPADPEPGYVIQKKPRVENTSKIPVYVRVRAEVSNSDLLETIHPNVQWTLEADGFYYYNHVLEPGETTDDVFDSVTIKSNVLKEEIKNLDVLVYAEAVQAGDLSMDEACAAMD